MKKNILKFLLVVLFLFIGTFKVNAYELSYKTYQAGDEIEVLLNEKKLTDKFYVIEDNKDSVVAIYKDVLGEMFWFAPTTNTLDDSEAEKKLDDLTKEWNTPDQITLLEATQIKEDIRLDVKENYEFSEPKYLNIGKSYWTKTVVRDGEEYYPYLVTSWGTYSDLHHTQDSAPSNGGYIRPVIKINKYMIKDSAIKPKTIEEFAEGYEKYTKKIFDPESELTIETKILENGIFSKITYLNDDEKNKEEVTFDYDGKVLSFEDYEEKFDSDFIMAEYISKIIFYDIYTDENLVINSSEQIVSGKYFKFVVGNETIKEMSFDLEHYFGFSSGNVTEATTKNDMVENPKTADVNVIFLIGGITLCASLIVLSKKRICKIK